MTAADADALLSRLSTRLEIAFGRLDHEIERAGQRFSPPVPARPSAPPLARAPRGRPLPCTLLANDPKSTPPDKYAVLADGLEWMTNLGAPGHASAAIDDAYGTWVLNTMFARAATAADSAE